MNCEYNGRDTRTRHMPGYSQLPRPLAPTPLRPHKMRAPIPMLGTSRVPIFVRSMSAAKSCFGAASSSAAYFAQTSPLDPQQK